MATIPASAVNAYREALGAVSVQARSRARALVRAWCAAHPGDVAGAREYARAAVAEIVARYGDAAAEAACAVYDELAAQSGSEVPAAEIDNEPDEDQIERVARYQAGKLAGGDAEGFAESMASYAAYAARSAAQATVEANCRRDNVRYARVPGGSETCPWCTMLASRGFAYWSREAAGHASHRNCDCVVVPGFDGMDEVEGYDTSELLERYLRYAEEGRIGTPGTAGRGTAGRISYDEAVALVDGARSMDELREACAELSRAMQDGRLPAGNVVSALRSRVAGRRKELGRSAPDPTQAYAWAEERAGRPVGRKATLEVLSGRGESSVGAMRYASTRSEHVTITKNQLGKKFGKHAREWGINFDDPDGLDHFTGIIDAIINEADDIGRGEWRGQPGPCTFYRRGDDLVIVNARNSFVTVMKGGAWNVRYQRAIGRIGD